jgi:hypothetical protein
MRMRVLLTVVAAATISLAATGAVACGRGGGGYPSPGLVMGAGIAAIGLGITDLAFSGYDLAHLGSPEPASATYGTVETILAGGQLALGIAGMTSSNASGFWTGYSIWMGALTLHGIWTIIANGTQSTATLPAAPDPPSADPQPALQISFGPTYAPVGQLAHPGFGLVGRF